MSKNEAQGGQRVLVANRGEIASRVITACDELGLGAIAVYEGPDAGAPHVRRAQTAVALDEAAPGRGYRDIGRLIAIARATGAWAIHPGYGFLAEDAAFAAACEAAGLVFIGPSAGTIAAAGDKWAARAIAAAAGVPVLPGGQLTADEATWPPEAAYPVMVKATGGGGGIGMVRVTEAGTLGAARAQADAIAEGGALYWESHVSGARHVEVQVMGDGQGHVMTLGVRECSLQRRFQKVIEETPPAHLDDVAATTLEALAAIVARALGYRSAGTVEFLWMPGQGPVFLEVNARLQVEHAVTELVWGVDLVHAQLRLALGESLADVMAGAAPRGHATEARVYAEDGATGLPAPGRIDHLAWPTGPGIRVDAGYEAGMDVPPHYDALLAKVVAWAPDRAGSLARLAAALDRTEVAGTLDTNLPKLRAALADPRVRAGAIDTATWDAIPASASGPDAAALGLLGEAAPTLISAIAPAGRGGWGRRPWRT